MKSLKTFILAQWQKLHEIRAEPEAVAGGAAIGIFMGFTPFIGFKTLLAIFVAWVARCSKMAAVIAVTLHDVLVFFAPMFIWLEYHIGNWILGRHALPNPPGSGHRNLLAFWHHWGALWNWDFLNHYIYPIFIGSIVVALPFTVATYFVTHGLLVRRRARRLAAEETARATGAAVDPNDI